MKNICWNFHSQTTLISCEIIMHALDLDGILRYAHESNRDFFFSYSVYNRQKEREGWEKDSHEDWETKLPHRLKVRTHYCTVLKCFIPCISTVLNALAQVKHAVGCCFFHIPLLVLLEVQMGRNLQNSIIWILMCHCLGWSISVFVLIPEDWYLQVSCKWWWMKSWN